MKNKKNFNKKKKKKKSKEWGLNWKKKQNNIKFYWMMKFKTNKTLTKELRKKLEIKRIRTELKKIIYDKL